MSFREWLYETLVGEGDLDAFSVDVDELDVDFLLSTTELDMADIDNYRDQFTEYCQNSGITPEFDI